MTATTTDGHVPAYTYVTYCLAPFNPVSRHAAHRRRKKFRQKYQAVVMPEPIATNSSGCQCSECMELFLKTGAKHWSDCAVHNMPAEPNRPCNCGCTKDDQPSRRWR